MSPPSPLDQFENSSVLVTSPVPQRGVGVPGAMKIMPLQTKIYTPVDFLLQNMHKKYPNYIQHAKHKSVTLIYQAKPNQTYQTKPTKPSLPKGMIKICQKVYLRLCKDVLVTYSLALD